jgi:hypothetical protein
MLLSLTNSQIGDDFFSYNLGHSVNPVSREGARKSFVMAGRVGMRHVARRFFSSGGKVLSEEEKAAENVYIKVLFDFLFFSFDC